MLNTEVLGDLSSDGRGTTGDLTIDGGSRTDSEFTLPIPPPGNITMMESLKYITARDHQTIRLIREKCKVYAIEKLGRPHWSQMLSYFNVYLPFKIGA